MLIGDIQLTERGIRIVDVDGSTVDLCGKDVWELLKWMNWHILELGQRKEMEGFASEVAARLSPSESQAPATTEGG